MLNNRIIFFIYGLVALFGSGCTDDSYQEIKHERAELAIENKRDILVGISWPYENDLFVRGVKLAVKKINNEGGVLGRPLSIIINTEEEMLLNPKLPARTYQRIALHIANSFASNPDIIAVIGHYSSRFAILSAPVYDNAGIVFFAPSPTSHKLINNYFKYIFRTIPGNHEVGAQLAHYIAEKGYKKIAVFYDREACSTELSDNFSATIIDKKDGEIVFSRSFYKDKLDLNLLIGELKKSGDFDIIFVATDSITASKIYQKSRDMGIMVPFVGGESLASAHFLQGVKDWRDEKTTIPTLFNNLLPENKEFIESFKQEYGNDVEPDHMAALGYDNVMLLAHAANLAKTAVPMGIAYALRFMHPCQGITGKYQFSESGELASKPFYFKQLYQNKYKINNTNDDNVAGSIEVCNKIDRDNDGIINKYDVCPDNSELEMSKGIASAGSFRGCPVDVDHDLVFDYQDNCPDSTAEEVLNGTNIKGCPVSLDKVTRSKGGDGDNVTH
jgi:branched-chain amino acid transport system substrate-binding protein